MRGITLEKLCLGSYCYHETMVHVIWNVQKDYIPATILSLIDEAVRRISISSYIMTISKSSYSAKIREALRRAYAKGVDIAIILDAYSNHVKDHNCRTASILSKDGIDVWLTGKKRNHMKVYIADNKAFIGSANLTSHENSLELGLLLIDNTVAETLHTIIMNTIERYGVLWKQICLTPPQPKEFSS
ncbi:MAG: phospholipase D family protein [Sulfolobales archaeon]